MSNYLDLEKRKETQRKWRERNKEKLRKYYRDRYGAKYKRKWRDDKPGQREQERIKRKEYYERNREEELRKARIYMKEWHKKNKDKRQAYSKNKYIKDRQWFDEFRLAQKCAVCGFNDPDCLDFHHVNQNGTREKPISSMLCYSKKKIMMEMAKCIILCANCHRKEHVKLRREISS